MDIKRLNELKSVFDDLKGHLKRQLYEEVVNTTEIKEKMHKVLQERIELINNGDNKESSLEYPTLDELPPVDTRCFEAKAYEIDGKISNIVGALNRDKINDLARIEQIGRNKFGPHNPYSCK